MDHVGIDRAGAQEYRVEASLAGFRHCAYGFADHRAQYHQVAAGGLHLGNLAGEIGGAALVAGLFGVVHAQGFQAVLSAAQDFQAIVVVLVNRADLFRSLVLDQLGQRGAQLVVIGRNEAEFQRAQRFEHFACRRQRQEVDHVLFGLHRHRRHVGRRAQVAGHDEDLVLVHQLLRSEHGLLRVIAIVLGQQLELAPVHPALFVDLLDPQQQAVARLLAVARQGAGQVLYRSDQDFIFADTLGLCQGQRAAQRQAGKQEGKAEFHGHVSSGGET